MLAPETKEAVEDFFKLHEERVRIYKKLESGHRRLLSELDTAAVTPAADQSPAYRQAVSEATVRFSSVSQRILALLARMRTQSSQPDCVGAIERIQDLEREKLRLTCEMQLLVFQVRNHSEDLVFQRTLRQCRKRNAQLIDAINECIAELRCELYD